MPIEIDDRSGRRKYIATMTIDGMTHRLGAFDSQREAGTVYDHALHLVARLGRPDSDYQSVVLGGERIDLITPNPLPRETLHYLTKYLDLSVACRDGDSIDSCAESDPEGKDTTKDMPALSSDESRSDDIPDARAEL